MADKTSYIRLDRNIKRWRWWHDHNTLIVFLTLLLDANISEHGFSGIKINRGEVATSIPSLCNSTGLTIQQIRTTLQHLKSTGEITVKLYPKFQVITIVNYDKYQDVTGKTPYKQQATNRQATGKQQQLEKKENIENIEKERRESLRSVSSSEDKTGYHCGKSGNLKPREVGTVDDIPKIYRSMYKTYPEYYDARNS